ncbi:MAG TPA: hypothetical protein VGB59_08020 [Allosphingosinicella sp.]
MKKININELPELATAVGMHGSTKQKEVGGPVCIAVIVGIIFMGSGDTDTPTP